MLETLSQILRKASIAYSVTVYDAVDDVDRYDAEEN